MGGIDRRAIAITLLSDQVSTDYVDCRVIGSKTPHAHAILRDANILLCNLLSVVSLYVWLRLSTVWL